MNTPHANPASVHPNFLLARQRGAFLHEGAPTLAQRRADLHKLKTALLARQDEICQALKADFGHRSTHETTIMELMPLVQGINYLQRNLRRWMRPQKRHVPLHFQPASARIEYQPLGVIGIMVPWNYPVSLALMPLATALAAGNRAMLKPSEYTPATTRLLQTMLAEIYPVEQVAVVTGDATVGEAFSGLDFDHLVFTGSTAVGKAVMRAASEHLVPVTLELGGKSPAIVEQGHDLERSAGSIAYGKLANAGQTCIAPDYALVHEDALEAFVQAYDKAVRTLYPEGPSSVNYTAIVNERHFGRIKALLDDARARGARVNEVGVRPEDARQRPHTLAPTLVLGATGEMKIMQDEIFGPVLPVIPYRTLDEAIAYINAHPRPLALYYFGFDRARQRQVLDRTTSGNVTLNDTLLHFAQDDLPFGGVGPSGIGAYHGIEGFRALSHAKGIFQQSRINFTGLLRPPFGKVADVIMQFLLR